jgi:hypothetical protein
VAGVQRIRVVNVRHSLARVFVSRRREVAHLCQPIVGIVSVFDLLALGVRLRRDQAVVIRVADGSVLWIVGALQKGQNGGSDVVTEGPRLGSLGAPQELVKVADWRGFGPSLQPERHVVE